ncbi:MAG: hypothetical protein ACRDTG_01315, partial [Pseudonocardiaceae bacterium]
MSWRSTTGFNRKWNNAAYPVPQILNSVREELGQITRPSHGASSAVKDLTSPASHRYPSAGTQGGTSVTREWRCGGRA